jgi:hypothetical protein
MIKNSRCMILAAMPRQSAELNTIFSEQPESIRRKLESPPRLRASGWDLPTLAQAKILRGELIQVVEPGRMIVDLYRDGTFIVGGQIHRNFLAWSDKNDSHLHPLALIELTVNFTRFYRLVLDDFRTLPQDIELRVELQNMHLEGEKTKLGSGPVAIYWPFSGGKEAPTDSWNKEIVIPAESYDPDRAAYSLVRELYLWFGHSDEAIPYTKNTSSGTVIDADHIAQLR